MMKIALPILLAGIIMIAGIFAFMPIDKASTVHTTIQSTVQGTQLNNIASTFTADLAVNASAKCDAGSFLVYWTFTNATESIDGGAGAGTIASLLIDDLVSGGTDITINLALENQTSISGVTGGTAGETITFSGSETGTDSGDLMLTALCQSGASATLLPTP